MVWKERFKKANAWLHSALPGLRPFGRNVWPPLKWVIWEFLGFHAIWNKIKPPPEKEITRKPATFFLWFVGIYVAVFGVASQRYENWVDIIENRANAIFAQLATPARTRAFSRICIVQNMDCPEKPRLAKPFSIIRSLIFGGKYELMVNLLKETVEDWKDNLEGIDLSGADLWMADLIGANLNKAFLVSTNLQEAGLRKANLRSAVLWYANFQGADLKGADLQGADFQRANFQRADLFGANLNKAFILFTNLQGANLQGADLQGAYLSGADLRKANLNEANLQGAYLSGAYLHEADLQGANLQGAYLQEANLQKAYLRNAKSLTLQQLSQVNTLYQTKLDLALLAQVREKYPHLLEKPPDDPPPSKTNSQ